MKATTNVRRMIKRPSSAMAAGVRQRDAPSPRLPSLSSNTGNQQSLDVFDRLAPLPTPRTAARDGVIVQRKPRESETGTPVQDVSAVPLIADDDSEQVGPRQMRKSDFLAMLRTAVCAAVDEELASTGRSSKGCPHVDFWFTRAAGKPAAHVEQALRRFAPESIDGTSAADFVPVVVARVRQSVATWADTGAITGVPEAIRHGRWAAREPARPRATPRKPRAPRRTRPLMSHWRHEPAARDYRLARGGTRLTRPWAVARDRRAFPHGIGIRRTVRRRARPHGCIRRAALSRHDAALSP